MFTQPPMPTPDVFDSFHAEHVDAVSRLLHGGLHPRVVIVTGDLGAGKSTVLARVAGRAAAAGGAVRYVWSIADLPESPEAADALWVCDDVLGLAADALPVFAGHVSRALSMNPGLRILASVDTSHSLTVQTLWERFSATVRLLPIPDALALAYSDTHVPRVSRTIREHVIRCAGGNAALIEQAVGDLAATTPGDLGAGAVSRIPARYEHLVARYLSLPAGAQAALMELAVRELGPIDILDLSDAARADIAAHLDEEHSFVRRSGVDALVFVSAIHRATVLLHGSTAQRLAAHNEASRGAGVAPAVRALHSALAAGADGDDLLDRAIELEPLQDRRLPLLVFSVARGADPGPARWAELARLAVVEGDLHLAATALNELDSTEGRPVVDAGIAEVVGFLRRGEFSERSTAGHGTFVEIQRLLEGMRGECPRSSRVDSTASMITDLCRGWAAIGEGRWKEARGLLSAARTVAGRSGADFVVAVVKSWILLIDTLHGRVADLPDAAGAMLSDVDTGRHPLVRAAVWQALLHAAVTDGQIEVAMSIRRTMASPERVIAWTPYPAGFMMDLADLAAATAQGDVAFVPDRDLRREVRVSSALAYVSAIADSRTRAEALARLLEDPPRESLGFEMARVRLAYGVALFAAHRGVQARTEALAAASEFAQVGALQWRERARRASAGGAVPSANVAPLRPAQVMAPLTFQEERVVTLAATGMSNKEISRRLYLSPRTVGGHLYNAYPKLGVTSRAALRDALLRREQQAAVEMGSAS